MRVILRPTIASDLAAVIAEPLPHRIQALTAIIGDRVLGIGGIGFRPSGEVIAFVHMNEEARNYPAAIHRAGIAAMQMIRESHVPIVLAEAQPGNPAAERWLRRLGFREHADGWFVWQREN